MVSARKLDPHSPESEVTESKKIKFANNQIEVKDINSVAPDEYGNTLEMSTPDKDNTLLFYICVY